MNNHHENTNIIDTQEQETKKNEAEQYELHDDTDDELIPDEELEHIHPELYNNIPYSTMNSGIIKIYQNDPGHIIDDPEDFLQYRIWLLSGHKGGGNHPTTITVTTAQLDGGSKSHVLTDIKLLFYIRPVQFNVQIINVSKAPAKGFGLFVIKSPQQTLLYHYGHHIICRKTHKTQSVKLH